MSGIIWAGNERVRVGVAPEYGARVLHLVDLESGRDWIAPGPLSEAIGEETEYLGDEARGWDECFPTVARCEAGAPWNRHLRDHGDLWGRPWETLLHSATEIMTRYRDPLFVFSRHLLCEAHGVIAQYEVRNLSETEMPFLWAMHLLLTVEPGTRIQLPDTDSVDVGYLSRGGDTPTLAWPLPGPAIGFGLDIVQPAAAQFAAKLYARLPKRWVRVGDHGGGLEIDWSAPWDHAGIWLNYGGWPTPGTLQHIAIEPTTQPTDTIDSGTAPVILRPGERLSWSTGLSFYNTRSTF